MIWAEPWWLVAMILPLAWLYWQWARIGPVLRLPMDGVNRQADIAQPWRQRAMRGLEALPALIALLSIILLAGPSREAPPQSRRSLTNIEFCLDVSGSMMAALPNGITRYDAAMDAITLFCEQRQGDAFGLTIFGDIVVHWLPLTQDLDALARSRQWLVPNQLPRQFNGTSIGAALEDTAAMLQRRDPLGGERMIILITDGQSYDLGGNRPQRIIDMLSQAGITVFAIAIGEQHQREVSTIVQASGGQLFTAADQAALNQCFRAIDALNPVSIERDEGGLIPWRQPWLITLAVLLAMEFTVLIRLRRLPW